MCHRFRAKCSKEATQSLAIGYKAQVSTPNTIVLGNSESHTFIPGKTDDGKPKISINVDGVATLLEDYIDARVTAALVARGL